jgi:hypothetical protein
MSLRGREAAVAISALGLRRLRSPRTSSSVAGLRKRDPRHRRSDIRLEVGERIHFAQNRDAVERPAPGGRRR